MGLREKIDLDVLTINGLFLSYQLAAQRAFYYHVPKFPLTFDLERTFVVLLVFNLAFAGLSAGLLAASKGLAPRRPALLLGLTIPLSALLIREWTPSAVRSYWALTAMASLSLFLPSVVFGMALARRAGEDAPRFLLNAGLGAASGVLAYHTVLGFLPFALTFAAIALTLITIELRTGGIGARFAAGVGCALIAFTFYAGRLPENGVLHRAFTPLGVTEAYSSGLLATDRASPSYVARRGDPSSIQTHADLPYRLRLARSVLILGSGGGQDVAAALRHGADRVVAIEMDKTRARLMRGKLAAASDALYLDPRVELIEDEARHALRYIKETFDLIVVQRPWTTFFSAGLPYDYAFRLLTSQAFREYSRLLKPDGRLFIALPYKPRQTAVWQRLGAAFADAWPEKASPGHVALLKSDQLELPLLIALFARSPFSREECRALGGAGLELVHAPGARPESPLQRAFFKGGATADDRLLPLSAEMLPPERRLAWLFSAALLLALLHVGFKRFPTRWHPAGYLGLGIAYLCLQSFLMLHAVFFLGDTLAAYQIALTCFILFGGIGYLHAASAPKPAVPTAGAGLLLLIAAIGHTGLLWDLPSHPVAEKALAGMLCGAAGYLSAYPFGFAVSRESDAVRAYAWDSLGTLLGFPILLILLRLPFPDMALLLGSSYAVAGLSVFLSVDRQATNGHT